MISKQWIETKISEITADIYFHNHGVKSLKGFSLKSRINIRKAYKDYYRTRFQNTQVLLNECGCIVQRKLYDKSQMFFDDESLCSDQWQPVVAISSEERFDVWINTNELMILLLYPDHEQLFKALCQTALDAQMHKLNITNNNFII